MVNNQVQEGQNARLAGFALATDKAIKECIDLVKSVRTPAQKICLGLMVRLHKLGGAIIRNGKQGDGLTTMILVRSYYETSLTLVYLLANFTNELFDEFVLTDAMRRRDIADFYKKDLASESPIKPKVTARAVSDLEKSIQADGYTIATLPKSRPTGSWHRSVSYARMASSLGDMAEDVFVTAYNMSSNFVHPSWSDIRHSHLKEYMLRPGDFFANNEHTSVESDLYIGFCVCMGLSACSPYAQRFSEGGGQAKKFEDLHKAFHRDFNSQDIV